MRLFWVFIEDGRVWAGGRFSPLAHCLASLNGVSRLTGAAHPVINIGRGGKVGHIVRLQSACLRRIVLVGSVGIVVMVVVVVSTVVVGDVMSGSNDSGNTGFRHLPLGN